MYLGELETRTRKVPADEISTLLERVTAHLHMLTEPDDVPSPTLVGKIVLAYRVDAQDDEPPATFILTSDDVDEDYFIYVAGMLTGGVDHDCWEED